MTFKVSCCFLLWTLFITSACNEQPTPQQAQQINANSALQPSVPAPELMPKGLFDQDPRGAEAWQQFTQDGRYRVARSDDFQIPELVMREHLNDPFFTNKFSYVGGDFNRDGRQMDRAFIVVDTTTTVEERFALIVFNAPTDDKSLPSVHWVLKTRDLSKSVLSAATDVLSLTEYHEDGAGDVCHVRWNKNQDQYSCEKTK